MQHKVLLIDDDVRLVIVLQIRLEASGYQVFTAYSGPEGLAIARQVRPDVIVLDVSMPGLDGNEVCRRVRAEPMLRGIPIIVMTAITHDSARHTSLEAGADRFIAKPYEATTVIKAIRDGIDDCHAGLRRKQRSLTDNGSTAESNR
jgi:two-component system cell cycle response regulator